MCHTRLERFCTVMLTVNSLLCAGVQAVPCGQAPAWRRAGTGCEGFQRFASRPRSRRSWPILLTSFEVLADEVHSDKQEK